MKKTLSIILIAILVLSCKTKVSDKDEWTLVWEENFDQDQIDSSV